MIQKPDDYIRPGNFCKQPASVELHLIPTGLFS